MIKRPLLLLSLLAAGFAASSGLLRAQQTENNVLHILPAPGPVKIDGKVEDWDLSGGIFGCDDVQRLADSFSVWFFAMYDKDNLYLLTKWKDLTPLDNLQSSNGGHGFAGDCLQVRFIFNYKQPDERVSHWMAWRDRDKVGVVSVQYDRNFKGPKFDDALAQGCQQAFQIDPDNKGYIQEMAIPWKLLTPNGKPIQPGDTIRMALEPNFTGGPWGRLNIHEIFREGVVPDRVFTFRAYDQWGEGIFEPKGHMPTVPVRLSDAREFPTTITASREMANPGDNIFPTVNWTGLVVKKELPGFKPITFDAPADGDVSLNINDAAGNVVRQLLTENYYDKGKHTVKWDGLSTPYYKTPGEPVPAGTYTLAGLTHPPFKLTLRGWAHDGGSTPWENGPTTHWGGDHGNPMAAATDANHVYLGWGFSEAGKGLLGCDLDGNVIWKNGSGLGGSSEDLAVDGPTVYSLGNWDSISRRQVLRLRAADGVFDSWKGTSNAGLEIPEIWADMPDKASWPKNANGLEVKNGKMYLSFSRQSFFFEDFTDWKAFFTKLTDGQPLDQRIYSQLDGRNFGQMKNFLSGHLTEKQLLDARPANVAIDAYKVMDKLLDATDLAPNTASLTPAARAEANRKFLEQNFAGAIAPLKTNFIAVCDASTGKLIKTYPAPYPQSIHMLKDGTLGFVSDGSSIQSMDMDSGAIKPVVTGLNDVSNFAVGADGKIYVAEAGTVNQVKIFTADGKPSGTVGRPGGRQLLGAWQPDGIYNPSALAVDNVNNRLWVTENDALPKRVSLWNLADDKLVKDFFGAAHYGASGGAIDPLDPNVMVGSACEWLLDPATGHCTCVGIFDRTAHGFAVFVPASNGRLYLAVNFEVLHGRSGTRIFERTAPGIYIRRAELRPDYATQTTTVWSDINGDGKEDPNEVTVLPYTISTQGALGWSMNMNPTDFTLFGGVTNPKASINLASVALRTEVKNVKATQTEGPAVYRINPDGFTACGAPKWDLKNIDNLDYVYSTELEGAGYGMLPSKDNKYLMTTEAKYFRCFDLVTKKEIWNYPNTFNNVHGSHAAPPPIPGLFRGAYGLIGTFTTPKLGTVWCINGNCGEWYLLSEKGYYVGHLFQSDAMKMHYPEKAVPGADLSMAPSGSGGEDFGGSLTQGKDGNVYIEAGKTGYWNVLATGFDQVQPITIDPSKVTIGKDDLILADKEKETQLQAAVGTKMLEVKTLTPTFTGNLNADFKGLTPVTYDKGSDAMVRSVAAWDDKNLYVAWEVSDNTPWANAATEAPQMYVSGDTVDLQLGTVAKADPKRSEAVMGDLRLSIGNFQGKPTAVLYRAISEVKKPRSFTSGVIAHYQMDYVDVVPDAQIQVKTSPRGYLVEAAIPWSALGFTPEAGVKYRGDMGVTYGNESSTRTRLRVYWNNQQTGLVDDAVFELKMTPHDWGDVVFEK